MPEEFEINVTGIEDVCKELEQMPTRLVKNAFARALAAASVPVAQSVLARTPVQTGALKQHLLTDIAVSAEGKGGTAKVGFGKFGHIARFVEYGHREIGHKPDKKELGTVSPKPFMRPAVETSAEASIEAFAESIRDSVNGGLK